jgi:hypothetical protein
MIYFLISIAILSLVLYWFRKASKFNFCALCGATVITWVAGLMFLYKGRVIDPVILAILMGASVGAVATLYGNKLGLFWKTSVVVLGAPFVYFLLQKELAKAAVSLGCLLLVSFVMYIFKSKQETKEDNFKNCC